MKTVFIYQIIDALSENVLQNFFGPNDRFATSVFERFCNSDGMKNADLADLLLVSPCGCNIFESFGDYEAYYNDAGVRLVANGSDFAEEST